MPLLSLDQLKAGHSTGFFITGTDTDIGKTYVSANLIRVLQKQGLKVSPRKPIASGCIAQADGSLLCEDAYQLQQAMDNPVPLNEICHYQFQPALSPQTVLDQSGQTVTTQNLIDACRVPTGNFQLVEGAGGFLSPLCSNGLNRDLAVQLKLPVILVVGNRLGCLNHALLSIEAITRAGLELYAIVINDLSPEPTNYAADLGKWRKGPIYHMGYNALV